MNRPEPSLRRQLGVLTLFAAALLWFWAIEEASPPNDSSQSGPEVETQSLRLSAGGPVEFSFSPLGAERGFEESGGNLVGVHLDGADLEFGSMTTFLDRSFPRQGLYSELTLIEDGVVSLGVDSGNPEVEVKTRWTVVDGGPSGVLGRLAVETTVGSRPSSSALARPTSSSLHSVLQSPEARRAAPCQ